MNAWLVKTLSLVGNKIEKWMGMRKRHKKVYRAYTSTKRLHNRSSNKRVMISAFATIAMQAKGTFAHQNKAHFNTDSEPIGIDNWCTGCISHKIEDFEGPLILSTRAIKGFGGSRTLDVKIGTITWKWLDDEGMTHKFIIPKSFYVASGNVRLRSLQHWAQTQHNKTNGTGSETLNDRVTLFWNHQKTS
jgi:hypothetical protein